MTIAFGILFCIIAVSFVFAAIGIYEAFSDSPFAQAERRRMANERFKEIVGDEQAADE